MGNTENFHMSTCMDKVGHGHDKGLAENLLKLLIICDFPCDATWETCSSYLVLVNIAEYQIVINTRECYIA